MKWKIFLLIAVISTAVYANSFQNSFHFDDQHFIVENTYIRDIRNIPSFFFSPDYSSFERVFTSHYRPLLVASYAINYAIGGLRPEGYHAVNLILHIGSAFLLFLIMSAMLGSSEQVAGSSEEAAGSRLEAKADLEDKENGLKGFPVTSYPLPATYAAITSALVFVVHPFNSEVVNYITARSSVMCSFFYLLSFYCWVKYRQSAVSSKQSAVSSEQTAGSRFKGISAHYSLLTVYYFASILTFILAILTKEIAITLPAVLFLYDMYFHRKLYGIRRHNSSSAASSSSSFSLQSSFYLYYLPYIFLIIIPYLLYRVSVYGAIVGGTRDYLTNFMTQPGVLLKYIKLMFIPSGLAIDHDIRLAVSLFDASVILPIASLLIVIFIAYLLLRLGDEWRVMSFFILWFFITLLPTTVIPLNAVLQENRGYLAGMALPLLTGIVVCRVRKRLILPVLAGLIILLSILTVNRNYVWRSDLTLWSDAVAKYPMSARAHDNLGLAWMGEKQYDRAIDEFNKTLELNNRYYLAYYNAGVAYQLQGDLDNAKMAYESSLRINPAYFRSYYNVGIVYKRLGLLDMSAASYEKAIALDARHPFVYNNLGIVLTEKGDYKRAVEIFKRAVELNPGYEKAYYNLGNVYFRTKEYGKAAEAYSAAIRIRPDYKEAQEMLNKVVSRLTVIPAQAGIQ